MNTKIQELIAAHLNVTPDEIIKASELYKVWSVVVKGRRGRFVSKAKVLGDAIISLSSVTWKVEATTRRQEGKKWVARIDGLDAQYGFKRTFLSAKEIEWGKFGMRVARFEIEEIGFYQDSDGDYFKVFVNGNELDAEICSRLEVSARFGAVKV